MFDYLLSLELFARGGGGGSSSGGGGGELIVLIGYIPSYYLGKLVKKFLPRTAELIVSAAFASLASLFIALVAFMSHSFAIGYMLVLIIVGIWLGWGSAFFGVWEKLKKKSKRASKKLALAATKDTAWNQDQLIHNAKAIFMQYQDDWSNKSYDNFTKYCTSKMVNDTKIQLIALEQMFRKNTLTNIEIVSILIIDLTDDEVDANDTYAVAIEAKMYDSIVDTRTDHTMFVDTSSFIEYWTFRRKDNTWLLESISQATADTSMQDRNLMQFAQQNSMMYRLDMGWLFLPAGGSLMDRGSFGRSDVNNYCAGMWGDRLVQLYTYMPAPKHDNPVNFVVGQLTVPKSYSGIIVRPKPSLWSKASGTSRLPKGYQKYSFEWPDFNKRYEVYALRQDSLATFELLNPGFMAYLYDTDPKITLEVADNVIYFHKQSQKLQTSQYPIALTLLQKAHKELQL